MLVGRTLLDKLQKNLEETRDGLSKEATAAYEFIKKMGLAVVELQEEKIFDEFKELFSPEYTRTMQAEIDEISSEFKQISELVSNNELIMLLQKADDLTVKIALQADLLEELRLLVIQGIKDTLNQYYFILREQSNKEFKKLTDSVSAPSMRKIGELEQNALRKITSLLDYYKISHILAANKIIKNPSADKYELCFSDVLIQMPLTEMDLISCASKVINVTKNPASFEKLYDKPVGDNQTFQTYFRCEWSIISGYYLSVVPAEKKLIEGKLISDKTVRQLEDSKKEKSVLVEAHLKNVVMPRVKICQSRLDLFQAKLFKERNSTLGQLEKIEKDLQTAVFQITALSKENAALSMLVSEQEVLLSQAAKIPAYDHEKYEEAWRVIREKVIQVQAQRKIVEGVKQFANDSIKRAGEVFAKEKGEEIHLGKKYLAIKRKYTEEVYPSYNDALKNANHYLQQSDNGTNLSLRNFSFHLSKLKTEAEERKRELSESKELQNSLGSLENKFKQIETAYFQIEKLLHFAAEKKGAADKACDGVTEDSWLMNLQERLIETEEQKNQLNQVKVDFDTACAKTAKMLKDLYGENVSPATKASKNYKEFVSKLDRLRDRFLERASAPSQTFELSEKVDRLKQQKKAKEAELLERFLMALRVPLGDTNMFKWEVVGTMSFIDGATVKINGRELKIPRGICKARNELNELKNNNQAEVAKNICLRMRERLNKEGEDPEKPTTAIYSAVSSFLVKNDLEITEDKLEYLIETMLKLKLQGMESLTLSVRRSPA